MAEKSKPGWAGGIRSWPVVRTQDATHHIVVDREAESQRDLLGNAGTTPAGITLFRCHNGLDEVLVGSLGPGPTPAPRREQHTVLSLAQQVVQVQQRGGLQGDGGTEDTCRGYEKGAQAGD